MLAGAAPRKAEMREAAVSRGKQAHDEGVEIRLKTRVTAQVIERTAPDAVIIATGAVSSAPDIPGSDLPNVFYAEDVLSGKERVEGDVVVVGGVMLGVEAAEYLAFRRNRVTIVDKHEGIGREFGRFRQVCVSECLKCEKIKIIANTKCVEIKEGAVVAEKDGRREEIACDSVVIAAGAAPADYGEIKDYCKENNIPYYIIGDAKEPRYAINAIAEGAEIGRKI
jgi:pyruvate/2-oxoglutarate dehydrogenase complex dihydrolipoamide dehydrogenase (E3) component